VLGGVNTDAYLSYKRVRQVSLRDALTWDKGLGSLSDREASGLYGTSWFFMHWLYNTHPDALGRYEDELGKGTEPKRAFDIAFPGFDADATNRELYEYQRHGKFSDMPLPLIETRLSADSLREELLPPDQAKDLQGLFDEVSKKYAGKRQD